ncbi:hypothetical protein Ait01nite_000240 [Actinoplanes italicus]|uniref:Extracellular solute-binding protein n=1 Tax=Actinoplanes italicus TaxID=113567 RepID=A0A2T0KDD6_9ACTN|nr:hypothetical protein [Actinoplanes italicus]PRX21301.1 hypothetical protein CLV67_10675 [Actinoplanes italicus]GIE26979.1 hypothetical protein Ait01nite_000240 [Actinoplanes italicus]
MRLRLLAVVVAVLLILVVVWQVTRDDDAVAGDCATTRTEVSGIVGSEKEAFLSDARVVEALGCAGFTLRIDADGSRDMAERVATGYDFAFPSSTPTAEKIMRGRNVTESYKPFSSVMVVATFKPTVEVLRRKNVVETVKGRDVVSIAKLVEMSRAGVTWKAINEGSPNGNVVMLRTTDPADSNSAIMFLSIASAALNDGRPVGGADAVPKLMPDLCRLVLDQGTKPNTSGVLFEEYLTGGAERIPMALIYESQFLDSVSDQKVPAGGENVLLFPNPTVYAWHTLVPLTPAGGEIGRLLRDDDTLKDIAVEYGFRPQGRRLDDRPNPPVVVEPPDYQVLEEMLDALADQRKAARCPK